MWLAPTSFLSCTNPPKFHIHSCNSCVLWLESVSCTDCLFLDDNRFASSTIFLSGTLLGKYSISKSSISFCQERGREKLGFPVAELFKPKGLKECKARRCWPKRKIISLALYNIFFSMKEIIEQLEIIKNKLPLLRDYL